MKLDKYLVRIYRVLMFKTNKYGAEIPHNIFKPLTVFVDCQLLLETQTNAYSGYNESINLSSGVPLVDLVVNIDMFNSELNHSYKIMHIIKELF